MSPPVAKLRLPSPSRSKGSTSSSTVQPEQSRLSSLQGVYESKRGARVGEEEGGRSSRGGERRRGSGRGGGAGDEKEEKGKGREKGKKREKGKEGEKEKKSRWEDLFAINRKQRRVAVRRQGVGKEVSRGNPRVWRLGGLWAGLGYSLNSKHFIFFCKLMLTKYFRKTVTTI